MPTLEGIKALYEAGHVKRMHAVPTLFTHTIAEHCYGVGCLAVWLCDQNNVLPEDKARVLTAVLYHDAPEVWTGDVPAHMKKMYNEIDAALSHEEAEWMRKHNFVGPYLQGIHKAVLQVADRIDLAMLCAYERSMGNTTPRIEEVFDRAISYAVTEGRELKGVDTLVNFARASFLGHNT